MPCPKCGRDDEVLALRERLKRAESERDTAREECERLKAKAEHCEESWKRCAGWLEDAYEAVGREERQNDKTLAELIRPIVAECDKLKAELANAAKHRDHYKAIIEDVRKENDKFCRALLDATGVQSYARTDGSIGFIGKDLTRRSSRMRRIIKWSLISALLLGNVAHVVPLSSVYEAATFESRGAFHEFQVCAKCSASRAGGAVCPACGSRESSSLVGKQVVTRLLGVWKLGVRWEASGPVSQSGAVAEVR